MGSLLVEAVAGQIAGFPILDASLLLSNGALLHVEAGYALAVLSSDVCREALLGYNQARDPTYSSYVHQEWVRLLCSS